MTKAFISYSHRDEAFRHELETHLAPLKRQDLLSTWHDRRVTPGDALDESISANLEAADLILMLISSDFVASDYCYTKEMARALERHLAGEARAVSIICRSCHFDGLPFARFLLLPTDAKPVSLWPDRDAAWVDVVKGIRTALNAGQSRSLGLSHESLTAPAPRLHAKTPRASVGLTIPRQFTDLDKHDYLETSFERIWAIFEANATDLEANDDRIVVRRVRIDAQSFSVRIFNLGKEVGGGSVFFGNGSFGRDQICFSYDPAALRNTMNEWIGVEVVDGTLGLKPSGMISMTGSGTRERLVDADGAAALLWEAVIQHVKSKIR